LFATRAGFNYVIAMVKIQDKSYLLDATDPKSIPNVLPQRVLNFQGRLINNDGTSEWVELFPDKHSIKSINLNLNFNDDQISGLAITKMDDYYAYIYRKEMADNTKDLLEKKIQNEYDNIEISNFRISNLDNLYKSATEMLQFETDEYFDEIDDKLYINPFLMWNLYDANPFKSKERKFPVYFNYPRISITNTVFNIPEGYEVVSLPESVLFTFGDQIGGYDYQITQKGNRIILKSIYNVNVAIVGMKDYQDLKAFIDKVINKQKEQIVLKKKQ